MGCLHRDFVQGYRQERQRLYDLAVETAKGYRTELAEYLAAHPLPTFKQWLVASAARQREAA